MISQSAVRSLRLSLLANAVLSLLTGLLIGAFAARLGPALGLNDALWLQAFAVLLLVHFVVLMIVHRRSDVRLWTQLNLICVGPYPFLLLAYLVFGPDRQAGAGTLVLADALAVGAVAVWQFLTWRASGQSNSAA